MCSMVVVRIDHLQPMLHPPPWEANLKNIVLSNVVKTFDSFVAVDHVSAEIQDGEFVTLLGPSGCGKTTLLNLISGFLKPDGGSIVIGGEDVSRTPPEQRDTAMCFQSYALFPHLSVRENIAFGLKQLRWKKTEIDNRITQLADQLDLSANLQKLPNELSGGQQQRVALGRALAVRPSVILFDEPLSNLDAKLRESVRLEIRKIQSEAKLTAIYVTHDQSEALAMSDRIFVLNKGNVEQSGTPLDIYNTPATRFVADFIGAANILEGKVLGQIDQHSWRFCTPIGELTVVGSIAPTSKRHYLCWRPEDAYIAYGTDTSINNTFTVQVGDAAFQGAFTDVYVYINNHQQRVHTKGAFDSTSQAISLTVSADKIRILEPIL